MNIKEKATMKQAFMPAPGQVQFRDVPIPEIKENELLIKVARIGICGSDIHVYHGSHPYTSYPVVQGHEVSGIIEKKDLNVTDFDIGDKVTVQPQVFCGKCYPCTHGAYHICDNLKVMGFQTEGMAAEYFAVDKSKVIKLPNDMDLDKGALIEPLSVAVHALRRSKDVIGKKVLVLGAGTIGNLVAQAAKGLGAESVMITDISDYRLGLAKKCGVDYCINIKENALAESIAENFGPDKADIILECSGSAAAAVDAINNARKGSDIIVVGVYGNKLTIDMSLVQDRELRIIGTLMYKREDYITAIDLAEQKRIMLDPLISNHFNFENYHSAYEYIESNRDTAMKVIISLF